jgi:hypothetical protein
MMILRDEAIFLKNNMTQRLPLWFWIAASAALLWNLLGVAAYLAEAYGMAQSDAHRALINARPAWATGAYAVAVFAGTLGCLALLIRHRWAFTLILTSFAALLVQQVWNFTGSGAAVATEPSSLVFAGAVVLVSLGLVVFARAAIRKGWVR